LDLNTCTKADLTFRANYELYGKRNDFVHGFLAWFDITFSACEKPVYFSTAPQCKYTHWKQTVFYLKQTLTVSGSDKISGWIDVAPNKKNERDLDIQIHVDFEGKYQNIHETHEFVLR